MVADEVKASGKAVGPSCTDRFWSRYEMRSGEYRKAYRRRRMSGFTLLRG